MKNILSLIIGIFLIISTPIVYSINQYDPYNTGQDINPFTNSNTGTYPGGFNSNSVSTELNPFTDTNPYSTPASFRSGPSSGGGIGGYTYTESFADPIRKARRGFSYGDPIYLGESIIINVADYEPKQVRESLLDQSNVPVFMYLKGTTLGTLLSPLTKDPTQRDILSGITNIPRITAIEITMNDTSKDFQHLAQNAIRYIPPRRDSYSLNNMGAVIVYLKKFDKKIKGLNATEEGITLDMNAKILLELESSNLFGVNEQDLSLKPYSDLKEFADHKDENSFFSGKGFVRTISIDNNGGTFEVYGKDFIPLTFYNPNQNPIQQQGLRPRTSFRLNKDDSKFITFGYTGNPFQDVFQVRLDDIITPTDRAEFEFQIDGKTLRKKVNTEKDLYPGSTWHLTSVEKKILGKSSDSCTRFTGLFDEKNLKDCKLGEDEINNLAGDFNLDETKISQLKQLISQEIKIYHIKNVAVIENQEGDTKTIERETLSTENGEFPLTINAPTPEEVNRLEEKYCGPIDKNSQNYYTNNKKDIACEAALKYKTIIDKYPQSDDSKNAIKDLGEIYEHYLIDEPSCKINTNPSANTYAKCFNFQQDMLKLATYYYSKIGLQDKLKDTFGGKGGEAYLEDEGVTINLKKVDKIGKESQGSINLKVYSEDGNSFQTYNNVHIGDRIKELDEVRYGQLLSTEGTLAKTKRVVTNAIPGTDNQEAPQPKEPAHDKLWKLERINSPTSITLRLYTKYKPEEGKEDNPSKDIPISGSGIAQTEITFQLNQRKSITKEFPVYDKNDHVVYEEKKKDVEITKVDYKSEAYVTIIPGSGKGYVTSNFKLHIPVDPRPFKWTPEMLNSQLNATDSLLKKFDLWVDKLDSIVKTWKKVCLGTFAFVTLKSSLLQGTTRTLARRESSKFWLDQCDKETKEGQVKEKENVKGHPKFDTVDQCISYHGDDIKQTTDQTQNAIEQAEKEVKGTVEDIKGLEKKSIGTEVICPESNKFIEASTALGIPDSQIVKQYQDCVRDYYTIKNAGGNKNYVNNIKQESNDVGIARTIQDYEAAKKILGNENIPNADIKKTLLASAMEKIRNQRLNKKEIEVDSLIPLLDNQGIQLTDSSSGLPLTEAVLNNPDTSKKNNKPEEAFITKKLRPVTKYEYEKFLALENNNWNTVEGDKILNKNICEDAGGTLDNNNQCTNINQAQLNAKEEEWKKQPALSATQLPLYVTDEWGNDNLNNNNNNQCTNNFGEIKKDRCTPKFYTSSVNVYQGVALSSAYSANNAYFREDGKSVCFPIGNGEYVRVIDRFPTGSLAIKNMQEWNVGPNGRIDCYGGGDDQPTKDQKAIDITPGLKNKILRIDDRLRCLNENSKVDIAGVEKSVSCIINKEGEIGQLTQPKCIEVMDPGDCKLLFNSCDPVMCPSSRCTLGGRVKPRNVIQSGIIGSTLLCLPNFKEGVIVPICLTGIDAGLKNLRSLIQGYHDCLDIKLKQDKDVGFCDYINSVGVCEVLWREASTALGITGGVVDWATGKTGQLQGGGEYINFQNSFNNIGDSVNFFTKEYKDTYTAAFLGQSSDEIGTQICRTSINGKIPNIGKLLDQLTEPENPPQFTAFFDEAPYAGPGDISTFGSQTGAQPIPAGTLELSQYKVFYHIYAGSGYYGGIYSQPTPVISNAPSAQIAQPTIYSVYLTNQQKTLPPIYVTFRDDEQYGSFQAKLDVGQYAQKSVQKVGPRGYDQICININGQQSCGFGKISSSFGLNELKDIVASKEGQRSINGSSQCESDYSGTKSASIARLAAIGAGTATGAGEIVGLGTSGIDRTFESSGISRVCSLQQPTPESGRWQDVGDCGTTNDGKKLGTCWMDINTISIDDAKYRGDLLKELKQRELLKDPTFKGVAPISSEDSSNILYLLNNNRNQAIDLIREIIKGAEKNGDITQASLMGSGDTDNLKVIGNLEVPMVTKLNAKTINVREDYTKSSNIISSIPISATNKSIYEVYDTYEENGKITWVQIKGSNKNIGWVSLTAINGMTYTAS